jgi:hypothetical protein
MKTAELTGAALDWAVAKCENTLGHYVQPNEKRNTTKWEVTPTTRRYSTNWAQGGPIIERELLLLRPHGLSWECSMGGINWIKGTTPLEAAMRCYVASKLGDTVDIPKELHP